MIERIAAWYAAMCDGDWEHSYGLSLRGMASGYWTLEVDNGFENFSVPDGYPLMIDPDPVTSIDGPHFRSTANAGQLESVLQAFLQIVSPEWANRLVPEDWLSSDSLVQRLDECLVAFATPGSADSVLTIATLDNPGWSIVASNRGPLAKPARKVSSWDWEQLGNVNGQFVAYGGPLRLSSLIEQLLDAPERE